MDVCCPELGQFIQRSWAGRPHLVARSSMRVSGKSRRNWSAGPRVLARTESSPTQSGTKQGGPSRDHWAKLGRLQYTRTQYSPVMIALFSVNFIAPPSRKKSSSASVCALLAFSLSWFSARFALALRKDSHANVPAICRDRRTQLPAAQFD